MGGINWLAQLAPPHAPAQANWWPLAPGWWGLIILVITVIAYALYYQFSANVRLRRAALRELKNIEQTVVDDIALASALANLLRRYAIARFGREAVASLSGSAWINFIVAHGGKAWAGDTGANLLCITYGGHALIERTRWLTGARSFLKGCK